MSQVPSQPELTELESALRALSPAPSRLDRDRLMFEAGARARRVPLLWPSAAAALALVVAGETTLLVSRPGPRVVERLVVIREPSTPAAAETRPVAAVPPTRDPVVSSVFDAGRSAPSEAILPGRWLTIADARRLQRRLLNPGLDGLTEPAGIAGPSGPTSGTPSRPASVGELRGLELDNLLNSGDPL
jgi:hypothetical protein